MKLQLAIDDMELTEAISLVEKVESVIDIIEIGTPFLYQEGMQVVRLFKEQFPQKEILADMKIMDAGYYETEMALKAGADYVTVLGVTDNLTIKGCVEVANTYGKEIIVDMICVLDLEKRIAELETLGVHGFAVHIGTDQQAAGRQPIDDLKLMKACVKQAKVSVAGGINQKTVDDYVALSPDVLIIGSGITHASDAVAEATKIRKRMRG